MKLSLKKSVVLFAFFVLAAIAQGCASNPSVVRTYEEDTTRVIESEPRIGQPVKNP